MATVASTLECVKENLDVYLPETRIEQACREAGHSWRKRKFDPVTTIHLFVLQVLHFNTAITHLRHLANMPINAAAYCKARMRLPVAALEKLLEHTARAIAGARSQRLWCGLRTYLVDASSAIAPDTADNQERFPQPKGQAQGCGFAVPKLLGLFDAMTGVLVKVIFSALYTHDLRGMPQVHAALKAGDLIVGDRAFCAYAHLALLQAQQVAGLFRMHASRITSFSGRKSKDRQRRRRRKGVVKHLGPQDRVVLWTKPRDGYAPAWIPLAQFRMLPDSMLVRELRFTLPARGQRTHTVILATTLLDPRCYPADAIAKLFGVRWTVETHFGELKTTLNMRRTKCQTAQGVEKEILVFCLVYNLIHALMLKAAEQQHVTPDRISFLDTLRWLVSAHPGEPMPCLLINPRRPHRHQPRVVKDRHDGYQRMTVPRATMNAHPERWPGRK
jgi:hypothetical protein